MGLDDLETLVAVVGREGFSIEGLDTDTIAVLDLDGLLPDTRYGYLLYARDDERVLLGHDLLRSFRTPSPYEER